MVTSIENKQDLNLDNENIKETNDIDDMVANAIQLEN